jgi:hypothetical protein
VSKGCDLLQKQKRAALAAALRRDSVLCVARTVGRLVCCLALLC